jgi:hypothetical protein
MTSVVDRAVADLAGRLAIPLADVEVVSAGSVTWPDGSLGCPQPGHFYTQALVPGYEAILRHRGRAYDYHARRDGAPFLCPSGEPDGGYGFVPPPRFDV